MYPDISGVILAGGSNKRFGGKTKALAEVGGKTILARILGVIAPVFGELMIVTNTPEEFDEYRKIKFVRDHYFNAGPLAGIHAALEATTNKAIFVVAGDMPLLNTSLIRRQVSFYLSNKFDIVTPVIGSSIEPLHSTYNTSVIGSLEEYLMGGSEYTVRSFLEISNTGYMNIEDSVDARNAFTNINSTKDILRVEEILKRL